MSDRDCPQEESSNTGSIRACTQPEQAPSTSATEPSSPSAQTKPQRQDRPTSVLDGCGGYQELADLMAGIPETMVLRRFRSLYILNLLYLQAQLRCDEILLQTFVDNDKRSRDSKRRSYCRHYALLSDYYGKFESSGLNVKQWTHFQDLSRTLKEYDEAIQRLHFLDSLPEPQKHGVDILKNVMGKLDIALVGIDLDVWQKAPKGDLWTTQQARTPLLRTCGPRLYHGLVGRWYKYRKASALAKPKPFEPLRRMGT